MFKITGNRGFHITFPNGITLSTQFGWGNYCNNYDKNELMGPNYLIGKLDLMCEDAEVAIFCKETWLTEDMHREVFEFELGNNVMGHVNINQWLKILDWCKSNSPLEVMLRRK